MSEKSKGVLIFATNTKEIDYIKIAKINAKLIKKYLGLPTTIVSGTKSSNKRRVDNEIVEWKNRHLQMGERPPVQEKCPELSRFDVLQCIALTNFKTEGWMESTRQLGVEALKTHCVFHMVCCHRT